MQSITPVYSGKGKRSRDFWAAIRSLPESKREPLYSLGVQLQGMEWRALRQLKAALEALEDEHSS